MTKDLTKSPCCLACKLCDDICIGCGRTLEEIKNWSKYTNEEKIRINKRIQYGIIDEPNSNRS